MNVKIVKNIFPLLFCRSTLSIFFVVSHFPELAVFVWNFIEAFSSMMMFSNCRCHALMSSVITTLTVIATMRCVSGLSPSVKIRLRSMLARDNASVWELKNVIEAQTEDYVQNEEGLGGVSLAKESAIKIVGDIQHKPGKAESFPQDLLRYNNVRTVDESVVEKILNEVDSTIFCLGQGVEDYKDPGQTTKKEVDYAPLQAVKDAITKAPSATEHESLVFNFLGGDDLMVGEVMEAGNELVLALGISTKTKVSFNSLSHRTIPSGTCTVTVVSLGDQPKDSLLGIEKAVACGEIYSRDGNWYSVEESDINTAIA